MPLKFAVNLKQSIDMKLNFTHSTQLRVRYGETDQMGYCYYGNYAQFFEVGRVETMRTCGMSYRSMEEKGIMLPVSEYSVKYHSPALYDDLLTIKTTIAELNGARLFFEYEITNETGNKIATATTLLVFVNKESMRPTKAPQEFIDILEKFEL